MTAEIAILNRNAVALAADSAVTIGEGKIYNSVDKLFQLSVHSPIGLMIFGHPNCLGVPMEVLIREFRREHGAGNFDTVEECANTFLKYLQKGASYPERIELEGALALVRGLLDEIKGEIETMVVEAIFNGGGGSAVSVRDEATRRVVEAKITELEKLGDDHAFEGLDVLHLVERDWSEFRDLFNFIGEPSDDLLERYRHLVVLRIRKVLISDHAVGLVFAGFGRSETFPHLVHLEIEARAFGRLKSRRVEEACFDMNQNGVDAHIAAFAQREVVETFLSGVIPEIDQFSRQYMAKAVKALAEMFTGREVLGNLILEPSVQATIDKVLENVVEKFSDELTTTQRQYRAQVESMVRFMPKGELAHLAEALVNLQSLRRRVSSDLESVGGPVDVAVVTKTEGFVWIRRKHYFDASNNVRWVMQELARTLDRG